jgi:glycosyltransferase involved in cell wall biosynthesis
MLRREAGLRKFLRTTFYNLADGMMVFSERSKLLCERAGVTVPIVNIKNSMDLPLEAPSPPLSNEQRCQYRLREGLAVRPRLLFIGRIIAKYELPLLFTALRLLHDQDPVGAPGLVLIGDGPARKDCEALVRQLGLDAMVTWAGAVYDHDQLQFLLKGVDLCVIPARAGLSVVHAMAFGIPVVTDRDLDRQMPESEAVVEGSTGFRFDAGDPKDLASVIRQALPVPQEMRIRCAETVRNDFSPQAQAERILQFSGYLSQPRRARFPKAFFQGR